ncbi:MAG: hypothetical protein WA418_13035 [Bradyrhizobium sp.]
MTPGLRVLERNLRRAPFGLRLWDLAGATHLIDGLEIDVTLRGRRQPAARASVNRSGVYYALGLPGLRDFELSDAGDETAWRPALRAYRVEVRDPLDRFLPFAFDADLPARGLFNRLMPGTAPTSPPAFGSPPAFMVDGVPLFSTPSRPVPEPLAAVRAQLREIGSDRPAACCLVTVSVNGTVCGIGLADREGRVAILFPYPDRPRPTLTSPPSPANDFKWNVELTAYYVPPPPDASTPEVADLAAVFAQLDSPRPLYRSIASPPQGLPALPLDYRIPLTVRTEGGPTGPSSYLYVGTA